MRPERVERWLCDRLLKADLASAVEGRKVSVTAVLAVGVVMFGEADERGEGICLPPTERDGDGRKIAGPLATLSGLGRSQAEAARAVLRDLGLVEAMPRRFGSFSEWRLVVHESLTDRGHEEGEGHESLTDRGHEGKSAPESTFSGPEKAESDPLSVTHEGLTDTDPTLSCSSSPLEEEEEVSSTFGRGFGSARRAGGFSNRSRQYQPEY